MIQNLKKGDAVKGEYMRVAFTGTVRSVRLNERTRNFELEIDFAAPLAGFGGRAEDIRDGVIVTGFSEADWIRKA